MWYYPHYLLWWFPLLIPLVIVDVILKAIGAWKAARNNQLTWFIFILIINTAGILPLIYILFFQKKIRK